MKICAAQIRPVKGDLPQNMAKHEVLIHQAVSQGAQLIVFPELSLTGYEPALARGLASQASDPRFAIFQQLSDAHTITICAGLPIATKQGTAIGMLIFQPRQPVMTYCKQYLHDDELPFFIPGKGQIMLQVGAHKIAPAICYEALLPQHAAHAADRGATLYLASVAKPDRGIAKARAHFPKIAQRYRMPILMANAIGPADNFISAGHTAAWDPEGKLIGALSPEKEGLLCYDLPQGKATKAII